ncbi:hypothetical protein A5842_002331, partial [Enterococcus faecium]
IIHYVKTMIMTFGLCYLKCFRLTLSFPF